MQNTTVNFTQTSKDLRFEFLKSRLIQFASRKIMSWTELDDYKKSVSDEEFQSEVDKVVDAEFHSSNYPNINNIKPGTGN